MRGIGDDRVRLLHGPYQAPRLHVGERTTCLFKDCDVAVTSWTDAPILAALLARGPQGTPRSAG